MSVSERVGENKEEGEKETRMWRKLLYSKNLKVSRANTQHF